MTRRSESGRENARHAAAASAPAPLGAVRPTTGSRTTGDRGISRPPLMVRRATLGDLPTIVELRLALLRENADHPVYGQLRAEARERAYDIFSTQLRSPHEVMLLAEREGDIVGILRCVETLNSPLLHPDRYCYISSVYVRPRARRSGVLKSLLRRADDWCRERGLTEMRLHNVPGGGASAAWAAEGFEVVEEVRRKKLPSDG